MRSFVCFICKKYVFTDLRKFLVCKKDWSAYRKCTKYKSENHIKRLDPQIAKPLSATFAIGPQI